MSKAQTKEQRLLFTEEAQKIVAQLSLEEKIFLMSGNIDIQGIPPEKISEVLGGMLASENDHYNALPYAAGGNERVGLPPMNFCDGPRGVVCGVSKTTCFPVSMARGASFDPALEEEIGHAIGRETRAWGGNLFAGVCINLPYHPGWGRSQESYGEETHHIGQMGAALVRGVQAEDVMACVKHFAFNQMENARFKVSVTCDQRTEKEVFLPHFKDCLDAGAASVMSSYNRYNGVQCGHHHYLLQEVLKGEWDFDGFVMSDFCWGVKDTVEAANGGQDMEMLWTLEFGKKLAQAVRDGFVPESRIDDAALRIVRTILAFNRDHREYDMSVVGCAEHIALAKRAAEESITLVKNKGVLPLDRKKIRKIALIGHLAKEPNIGDYGSSRVRPAYVVTPEEGIRAAVPEAEILYDVGSSLESAKAAAASADAVVFVVGYNHDDEGEFVAMEDMDNYLGAVGGDRKKSLGLHEEDIRLLQQVGPVNPNSTAVLIGGNMIMMSEWIDCVNSVLMAYYPGMEGGTALAEILFGDVNPSGKLPFVVPVSEGDLPTVDWEAADQYYEYYHGYTRLEKKGIRPLFPYGHGLSYTAFSFGTPQAAFDVDVLRVTVPVTNTGKRAGDEVVQVYVGYENSAVDRPVKQLAGFARISLNPGETGYARINIPAEKLKYYEPATRTWILENMDYTIWTGSSEAREDQTSTVIHI